MPIQWREEMAIDHGLIDRDHQSLIAIINEFSQAAASLGSPALGNVLGKLEHYARIHFGREEALQREVQYPYLDAHHHEHVDLTRQLSSLNEELSLLDQARSAADEAAAPGPSLAEARRHMVDFLNHWLADHIIHSDLRMRPYAAKMKKHARGLKPLMQTIVWVDR